MFQDIISHRVGCANQKHMGRRGVVFFCKWQLITQPNVKINQL